MALMKSLILLITTKHGTTDDIPAVLHSEIGIPNVATKILYYNCLLLKCRYKLPKNVSFFFQLPEGEWFALRPDFSYGFGDLEGKSYPIFKRSTVFISSMIYQGGIKRIYEISMSSMDFEPLKTCIKCTNSSLFEFVNDF